MLRRTVLLLPLLICSLTIPAAGQVGPSQDRAVSQMREIVEAIRRCPETSGSLAEEGAITRTEPPLILEWDVVPSDSLRAPFQGFVQFKVVTQLGETEEAKRSKELDHEYQFFAGLTRGRNFVEYRYEFAVGSEPPELRRALLFSAGLDTDFRAYEPSSDGSCWDKIARSPGLAANKGNAPSGAATESTSNKTQDATGPPSAPAATAPQPKVVSFAWADSDGVYLGSPEWVDDWVQKNAKNFPTLRFSQTPVAAAENYLVVLSDSTSVLTGFQPVARFTTTTSTADVSGRGTVTDSYGSMWSYSYRGTATTTTTSMTQQDVPYTLETRTLYASAYGGPLNLLVARNSESTARQEGGDPTQAVATDLGGLVRRIRMKTRLLDGVMRDIAKLP